MPPPFDHVAARSVDHAVELLNVASDARVLAGGRSEKLYSHDRGLAPLRRCLTATAREQLGR